MSARANPTAIGLFMIVVIVLSVVGVGALASGSLFGKRSTFISYFGESVNGLDVGAPVKFQGVPVGRVTDLLIQIQLVDKTFQVPVQYEVDLTRLTSAEGTFVDLDDASVLQQQIDDGLRAQLQMESVVTGQLYVELTYRPSAEPPEPRMRPTAYPDIPTTPSVLAAFGTEAGSLVADILAVIFRVNEMLEEVDMQGINTAVVASAQAVEGLVGSDELRTAIAEVPELAEQFGQTLTEMERLAERLREAIDPILSGMEGTTEEARLTLQATRLTIEEMHGLLTTDSGIGYGLNQTLTSLREASEALRTLVLSLERNPDMLIRGPRPPGR